VRLPAGASQKAPATHLQLARRRLRLRRLPLSSNRPQQLLALSSTFLRFPPGALPTDYLSDHRRPAAPAISPRRPLNPPPPPDLPSTLSLAFLSPEATKNPGNPHPELWRRARGEEEEQPPDQPAATVRASAMPPLAVAHVTPSICSV
jgi:hypothetical protein